MAPDKGDGMTVRVRFDKERHDGEPQIGPVGCFSLACLFIEHGFGLGQLNLKAHCETSVALGLLYAMSTSTSLDDRLEPQIVDPLSPGGLFSGA